MLDVGLKFEFSCFFKLKCYILRVSFTYIFILSLFMFCAYSNTLVMHFIYCWWLPSHVDGVLTRFIALSWKTNVFKILAHNFHKCLHGNTSLVLPLFIKPRKQLVSLFFFFPRWHIFERLEQYRCTMVWFYPSFTCS